MTVTAYYELDEIEALLSYIEAFRIYLKRQTKMSTNRKSKYLNFLKVVKKLALLNEFDEKKQLKLIEEVHSLKGKLSNEDWIIEKITELESRTKPSRGH